MESTFEYYSIGAVLVNHVPGLGGLWAPAHVSLGFDALILEITTLLIGNEEGDTTQHDVQKSDIY